MTWLLVGGENCWLWQEEVVDGAKGVRKVAWECGERGKPLSQCVKTTESSKLIVRLQKTSSGAPVREPMIDPETH